MRKLILYTGSKLNRGIHWIFFLLAVSWISAPAQKPTSPSSLLRQGVAAYKNKEFRQAVPALQKADSLFAITGDTAGQFNSRYYLGLSLVAVNRSGEGFACFIRCLELFQQSGLVKEKFSSQYPFVLMQLGQITYQRHELNASLGHFQKALEYCRASLPPDTVMMFSLLNNIGRLQKDLGRYTDAIATLGEAQNYLDAVDSGKKYNFYVILSESYAKIGETEKANLYDQKAFSLSSGIQLDPAGQLNNILAAFPKSPPQALAALDSLMSYLKRNQDTFFLAKSYQIKGYLLNRTGQIERAVAAFDSSLQYSRLGENLNLSIESYLLLGSILLQAKKYNQANHYFNVAGNILQPGNLFDENSWYLYYGKAKTMQHLGKSDSAEVCFTKSIELIETIRSEIGNSRQKFNFGRNKLQVYDDFITFLIEEQHKTNLAFSYVQKSKARLFYDLITEAKSSSKLSGAIDTENVEFVDIKSVKNLLGKRTGFADYYVTQKRTYFWFITPDTIAFKKIKYPERTLNAAVHDLYNAIRTRSAQTENFCKQFYDHIWIDLPKFPRTIYVSPHKELHYIPFQVLFDGSNYLVEKINFINIPNASIFLSYRKRPPIRTGRQNYAFAYPKFAGMDSLRFAVPESNTVSHFFPNTKTFLYQNATEMSAKQINDFNILHFACHGFFNPDAPAESFLALGRDQEDDGKLTVSDIMNETYHGNLVVLSACQSALGKILDGDEVVGFPRAFMYAGTPLVVASLWNINDEAGFLLMCSFYRYLSYHYSYSESLRTAQLDIMKGKFKCLALPPNSQDRAISFQHPYYWAPFVIYGYDRSLLDDRTQDVRE